MKNNLDNSARATALQITVSVALVSAFAILLTIAAPSHTKKTFGRNPLRVQPEGPPPTLGNYHTRIVSSTGDTTVTPDATPTNTMIITASTSSDLNGTLDADPVTGVVSVTDARPAGDYTVTVRAFNFLGGDSVTKTFLLRVLLRDCTPGSFNATTPVAVDSPVSAVVGDFNNDGIQDLAVARSTGPNSVSILIGNGDGTFTPQRPRTR